MRRTEPRRAIIEELRRVKTHPTAEEVYRLVRRRLPRVSLGTVYRNLDVLARAGMVMKLGAAETRMRFDGRTERHHHIRCLGCGRVADLAGVAVEIDLEDACRATDYEVLGASLEFVGLCPRCGRRRKAVGQDPARTLKSMQQQDKRRNQT